MNTSVYFDNAATTALRPEVAQAMFEVLNEIPGNPSSTHAYGRKAKSVVENARKTIAKQLNVEAGEIIFTSGGTEADNLVIVSAARDLGIKRLITSKVEHHAVLHAAQYATTTFGVELVYVNLKECGTPDEQHLESLLAASDAKTLVSLMHINNEIGNKIDLHIIGNLCRKYNALFHSDMVQSIGHYELDLNEIPVDFCAASAHKFHGPKGIGFAVVKKNSGLKSLIHGGGQERGLRAGTEGVHNIVGMEKAFAIAYENLNTERTYIIKLKEYFKSQLAANIPGVLLNGNCSEIDKSTYTLLNVCLPISDSQAVMLPFQLDMKGIACSKGSACQSGSQKGSHVLNEILSQENLLKPSLRFSFSKDNTEADVDFVVGVLKEFVNTSITA